VLKFYALAAIGTIAAAAANSYVMLVLVIGIVWMLMEMERK
jgi:hypothetical protein